MWLMTKANLARSLVGIMAVMGISSAALGAQEQPSREALLAVARETMESARFCGLATLGENGQIRVRTVDPFLPDPDWSVWFGTNPGSRKIQDIQNNPRATLYYYSDDVMGYVSISGTARIVDDPEEKANRWKEEWERHYPNRETDLILVQVVPDRLEMISYNRGILYDPETGSAQAVEFPGGAGSE